MGSVFNLRSVCVLAENVCYYQVKLPNLKLKTWLKQHLLCSLPLGIILPGDGKVWCREGILTEGEGLNTVCLLLVWISSFLS
jgi:hypothetical protein